MSTTLTYSIKSASKALNLNLEIIFNNHENSCDVHIRNMKARNRSTDQQTVQSHYIKQAK